MVVTISMIMGVLTFVEDVRGGFGVLIFEQIAVSEHSWQSCRPPLNHINGLLQIIQILLYSPINSPLNL